MLYSMYFDDATLQDWAASAGAAQRQLNEFMDILGTPFAPDKRQAMADTGVFLGLGHDLRGAWEEQAVSFWVRERLEEKVKGMIQTARKQQSLPAGTAAKLYGTVNFLETGAYGKIGMGSLGAIKQRQLAPGETALDARVSEALASIEGVISLRPRRRVHLGPAPVDRFLAASDAAWEGGKGTGGYLVVHSLSSNPTRVGKVVEIGEGAYAKWKQCETYIAQLELLMVLAGVLMTPGLRGQSGLWFIDNVAALMALVRGRSASDDLDRIAEQIHGAMFATGTAMYFEWVESKSNWSDGISRDGHADEWHHRHGFVADTQAFPDFLLGLPLRATVNIFEHLG
jgi:hypothetical protein